MQSYRSMIMRRQLDQRLAGLDERIGARPMCGWLKVVREALGMSTPELAARMHISASRASRLERAEVDDALQISTLRRAAAALNCRPFYVLVPDEPLEDMVLRQAYRKASEELLPSASPESAWTATEEEIEEGLEARTLELIDRRGLWRIDATSSQGLWTREALSNVHALPRFRYGRRGQGRPEADGVQP
jgi:predicted DNA-binding mobile mystery protein A